MMLFEGPARVCICFSKSFLKISMILLIISLIFKGFAEWVFFSFCGIFFLHSLKCLTSKSCWWYHGKGNVILVQHFSLLSQLRAPTHYSHDLPLLSSFFPPGQGGCFTPSQCLVMRKAGCPSQRSMGCSSVSSPAAHSRGLLFWCAFYLPLGSLCSKQWFSMGCNGLSQREKLVLSGFPSARRKHKGPVWTRSS